jgi:hypothetical protein
LVFGTRNLEVGLTSTRLFCSVVSTAKMEWEQRFVLYTEMEELGINGLVQNEENQKELPASRISE